MNIYSIHDKAINSYQGVIALQSERDAIDQFTVVCNQPDTAFYKHPADFTLVQIGTYDSDTAQLTPMSPKIITNAISLKKIESTSQPTLEQLTQKPVKTKNVLKKLQENYKSKPTSTNGKK